MKRTLSLVLALIMVLGSFTTVFAATEAEKTAAEFLAEEGVLLGANGDLMLENNLERRDAVVLLSRLLGVEDEAAEFATTEESPSFEDARNDAYYVPFIAWAEVNEYFEGDDEGNFNPRNDITAQEFALVLLRALEFEASGNAAWKAALEDAEELGLLKDVEVEEKEAVVRGEMAVMIFNTLGTEMNDSDETLAEYLGIEMPEDEKAKDLTADVYDTENLIEVVVELSNAELADIEKLENIDNYRLNNDRVIDSVKVVEDDVVILLKEDTTLIKGRSYELIIRAIDRSINGTYKFKAADNAVPVVESVEVLGEYGIKVTTSEPIKSLKSRNFLVDGKNITMNLEKYGRDIILTPYNGSFDEDASELTILELEDYAGFKSSLIREDIEIINDDVAPEVVEATRTDYTVTVEFDKDIFKDSVFGRKNQRDLGNVSYRHGRETIYAKKTVTGTDGKIGTDVAKYTFEDKLPRNVEITIEGVQNHSKVAMKEISIVPVKVADNEAAVIINNDSRISVKSKVYGVPENNEYTGKLTLKFDKEISAVDIEDIDLFELYEDSIRDRDEISELDEIITDIYRKGSNNKELVIEFKFIDDDIVSLSDTNDKYDYILKINDKNGVITGERFVEYVDFEFEAETFFNVTSIVVSVDEDDDESVIVVKFSQKLNRANAEDIDNYFLDDEALSEYDAEAFLLGNGKEVRIEIPEKLDVTEYENFEILKRVTRTNDDRLSENVFEFRLGELLD